MKLYDPGKGMSGPDGAAKALDALPEIPRDDDGPVFRDPWEAQAFAMTLRLYQQGFFTWPEWAEVLAAEIKRAQETGDLDKGDTYYHHWLNALECLVTEKGIANTATLDRYQTAWRHAADRTPHGDPIELEKRDFSD